MEEKYIIDSSAVIKYLNETFPVAGIHFMDELVDRECVISFVSEIELQVWQPSNPADSAVYSAFVSGSTILGISPALIHEAIQIRKTYNIKLPDALIAATAIVNNRILVADNDKDFTKIATLRYINPRTIDQ
ncbi:type II toxin-antitoxin system VapC family toxin [Spirosoma sp. KUDC1026]|uniref:type II toxin-antitoxin system VapC family toxin n=1 Tax=Spirosoma sp. KUDC1026 TaxID=2745947 RepID=UPI00159BC922|nr:type II toxin-antitoxin system VapC family toxin [Spirosoma sp. KUDC1026]QKZ15391.1 type II toxin-antitoxin system VapC family toxin [Spirosoma sp. KUDC1026]